MNVNYGHSPLYVFPDPVTVPEMLSGAAFLYFQQPLLFTLPPVVLTEDSYQLLSTIKERKPEWSTTFFSLFDAWCHQHDKWRETLEALAPLKEKAFKNVWLVYPADLAALERSSILAASSGLSLDSIAEMINPLNASGEIIRHILLEAFLELNKDIDALFKYCGELFRREPLPHLLAKGYFLRVQMLTEIKKAPLLLTNERLTKFLDNLPIETTAETDEKIDNDVIAWELFRQILSPRLDPLNANRAQLIAELLDSRRKEVENLRLKCHVLAEQVKQPSTLEKLPTQIERIVKTQVKKELAELLQLNRQALESFFTALFADDKTWLAIYAFIAGVAAGQVHLTTGGAIGALSSISAKAFKAAADRRQKLKTSDYTLVYTITRKR